MASPQASKASPLKASSLKATFTSINKRLRQIYQEVTEWKAAMERTWADEKAGLRGEIDMLKGQVSTLQQQVVEAMAACTLEEGEFKPSMIEELKDKGTGTGNTRRRENKGLLLGRGDYQDAKESG